MSLPLPPHLPRLIQSKYNERDYPYLSIVSRLRGTSEHVDKEAAVDPEIGEAMLQVTSVDIYVPVDASDDLLANLRDRYLLTSIANQDVMKESRIGPDFKKLPEFGSVSWETMLVRNAEQFESLAKDLRLRAADLRTEFS